MEIEKPLQRWCRWLSFTLAVLGALVLVGWYFNIDFFKRPIPDLVAMNPVTALCFVLSAVSLFLFTHKENNPGSSQLPGSLIATVVLVIGMLKLSNDLLGLDWGIDTWLFQNKLAAELQGNVSNRMAPNTAFSFILTGFALLLINKEIGEKKKRPAHYLALIIGLLGIAAIVGYLYQAQFYYGLLKYLPMAIHTAIGFILMALGILFLHYRDGVMAEFYGNSAGAIVARKLIPAAIVVPILFGFLALYVSWMDLASYEMSLTIAVLLFVTLFLYLIWFVTRELNTKDSLRNMAEERLKKTLKEVSDYKYALDVFSIVAITDLEGDIVYTNDNFCKISMYAREELIGQNYDSITAIDPAICKEKRAVLAAGKVWKGEVQNTSKNDMLYWVDCIVVPLLDERQEPFQYLIISTDIGERKKAEQQLKAANKELEAFSYSVAHDLRAPLRSLNGYSQILKEDYAEKLDDEASRIIGTIQRNATKMGMLIDDLLSFSRLGRKEVQKTNTNMKELVTDVVKDVSKSFAHHAKIEVGQLHNVEGDYTLLHQVMYNLIANAVKYTSKKAKPHVEIHSEERGNTVVFSVRDNGAGFDMSYADKLFGVFQRLHSQREFDGTGVGLAIVQRIINKHGGKAWAEGKVNEGATFSFMLPKK